MTRIELLAVLLLEGSMAHRFLPLVLPLVLLLGTPASAALEPMEPAHLPLLVTVGSPRLAPDGQAVVFSSARQDFTSDREVQEIKLAVTRTGGTETIGEGSRPRFSPDGSRLAFVSERDGGKPAIWLYEIATRESRKLVDLHPSEHFLGHEADKGFVWSPKGDAIAYLSAEPQAPDEGGGGPASDVKVVSRILYKTRTGLSDGRPTHVWWVATAGPEAGKPRLLTPGTFDEHSISISPDGGEIVFVSNRSADPDGTHVDDLWVVEAASGKVRRLTETAGTEMRPAWSPDGSQIAYLATRGSTNTKDSQVEDPHVFVMPATGGTARDLSAALDRRPHALLWHPNGDSLWFAVDDQGRRPIVRLPVPKAGNAAEGEPVAKRFTDGFFSTGELSFDRDGSTLAYLKSDLTHPAEVFATQVKARRTHQVTQENRPFLARVAIQNADTIWAERPDGARVQAWLMKPAGFRQAGKYPLVLWVHGGPHGMVGYGFSERYQILAGSGLGVLFVNPRGSTGYGQAFGSAALSDWGGVDYQDLLAALDQAIQEYPWIDDQRLGVAGGSYGGYMTNWVVTQTGRFRAAASFAGLSNLVSFYGTSLYPDLIEVEFGGKPWEGDNYLELWQRSPLAHVAKVSTPTLFLHGENDNDVPIEQAEEMYMALEKRGVDTLLVRYPGEGHGVRKPSHVADFYRRLFDWFGKYLQPAKPVLRPAEEAPPG